MKQDIIKAVVFLRENSNIPSEVIELMKSASLEKLEEIETKIETRWTENLDFDGLKKRITQLTESDVKKAGEGMFDVKIKYRKKLYTFNSLKESYTLNKDNCGFSRNHHNHSAQPTKESIFHDREDVNVTIWRDLLVSVKEKLNERKIYITTKKWTAEVKY